MDKDTKKILTVIGGIFLGKLIIDAFKKYRCPRCNYPVSKNDTVCPNCGQPLTWEGGSW